MVIKFPITGKDISLSLLSALLLVLSFPEFDLEFLAWIALVPLLIAIKDKSLKSAFGLSFFFGIFFFMGVFYWVLFPKGFIWIDFILLGIYLASYVGLFGLAFQFITHKQILPPFITVPVLWVAMEYFRVHAVGMFAVPLALLGHSQHLNLYMIQISSFTGVYGISFLIVMVNATLSEIIKNRSRALKPVIVTLSILGISLGYGFIALSNPPVENKINVTVIQGNILKDSTNLESRKRDLKTYLRLADAAANESDTSLIVWSEGATGGFLHDINLMNTISKLARETNTHLLIGSSQRPKFGSREFRRENWFSSAIMVASNGSIAGRYDKIHLLPFAEYLPLENFLPWPSRFALEAGNLIPGEEYTLFNLHDTKAKFGVTICWENVFPEFFRQFVKKGAEFMINVTNESIFGETAAPYHFLSMNVFRAVENRIAIARSAKTGISSFIDPYGRIIGRVKDDHNKDIFVEGYLTKEIPLSKQKTFYTRYGDIFSYLNLFMTICMLASSFFKKGEKEIVQDG